MLNLKRFKTGILSLIDKLDHCSKNIQKNQSPKYFGNQLSWLASGTKTVKIMKFLKNYSISSGEAPFVQDKLIII